MFAHGALHRSVENNSPSSDRHFNRSNDGYIDSIYRALGVCSPDRNRASGLRTGIDELPCWQSRREGQCGPGPRSRSSPGRHSSSAPADRCAQMRMQFLVFKNCPIIHHFQLIQSNAAVLRFGEDHKIGARWIEEHRYSSSSGKCAGKLAPYGHAC